MGWFSPVKGEYPGLSQVDKTLPVASDVSALERGQIVVLKAGSNDNEEKNGVWAVATAADTDLFFVALQDYNDPTAGFAGTSFNPKDGGKPCITAIDLAQDGEYETSVYDTTVSDWKVGDKVYVGAEGKLTNTGATAIGYLTAAPATRWVNNAIALPPGQTDARLAYRTGASVSVIRFKTK